MNTENGNGAVSILTNHPGRDHSRTWRRRCHHYLPEMRLPWPFLDDLYQAFSLFRLRHHFRVVVLGGGARMDNFYLLLQRLWPFAVRPVVKIDCLWYRSTPLRQLVKSALLRFLDRDVACYAVWAEREIADYSNAFGLPRHKFRFIPYHTTIDVGRCPPRNGDYLFSGGNFARDYRTLAKAVEGLELRVVIACTNPRALEGIVFPTNVEIVAASHEQFMQLMAGSCINVVPLEKGLLHSGGQQTFLNAMVLGKPVIVTDPAGAKEYVRDGVDGLLVSPGDAEQLRGAILRLHRDPQFAQRLAASGRRRAQRLDTERHLAAIVRLAEEAMAGGATAEVPFEMLRRTK